MSGRMNNPGLPPGSGVHLDQIMEQHAKQVVKAAQGRANMAMGMLHCLLGREQDTPNLPKCKELINLAFAMSEYFQTRAVEPLKETVPTIVEDG